jgi:hypothetical protein
MEITVARNAEEILSFSAFTKSTAPNFAAEDNEREHGLQLHELPHADPLRREIGDPQGDHDQERSGGAGVQRRDE